MRSTVSWEHPWEVMPDLYFYRDPEEIEKEEQAAAEKAVTKEEFQGEMDSSRSRFPTEDWSAQPANEDWSAAATAQATEWVATTMEWS
ncbi:40S ribosomal protein SA [Camelus dromedarius]|uniref:40S ribosomal protein SA n=1 Tax=Camelus dromedarius TaxID=9838 RepID=A0A5N4E8M1_CAMDR|nr:40S ribosomal protein SA [Camelus dromedarius]